MNTNLFLNLIVRPTLAAMGPAYQGPAAEVLLTSIALQESDLAARHQVRGPANGLYQFERVGIRGVLTDRATHDTAHDWARDLLYVGDDLVIQQAIRDNDILATIFARLLLYADPDPLPRIGESDIAWRYYLRCWRPGKPRPMDWADNYLVAKAAVIGA
jgi:hypothetical protein